MRRLPKEYWDDILVRMAHHSSALEGNTISLAETISIILHNQVSSGRNLDLREIYEIKNHEQAFEYLLHELGNRAALDLYVVKQFHSLLMDRLQHDRGNFKRAENAILGADFMTASVQETPMLMQQWVDNLKYRLDQAATAQEKIVTIADSHIQFERIHPFADGNGRTGRMIMNYSLLQKGFAPFIIHHKDTAVYLRFLAEQDAAGFGLFMEKALEEEEHRLQSFVNKEQQQIIPE